MRKKSLVIIITLFSFLYKNGHSQCENTGTDVKTACESFTWIDGNTYTTSNNTATHILTNASGCDSIITLNLTVNYSNTGTDTQVACDSTHGLMELHTHQVIIQLLIH
jgi:hypothetical protein